MLIARLVILAVAILLPSAVPLYAETNCDSSGASVDLAVEHVHLRKTEDGSAVVYALRNRGPMRSTSFNVALLVDGTDIGVQRGYARGLAPGHTIRWELDVPTTVSIESQQLEIEVRTATDGSAAGPGYSDNCITNNRLQVPASGNLATVAP